ncbi:MAG: hypothetical protein GY717_11835 [Rhodobacteraceae bacterium]|nr:hypothetical protein [Paracoccaceae bacterium]
MRMIIAALGAIVLAISPAMGAERLHVPPVDEGANNAGFAEYRARFLQAVVARDIDAMLTLTDQKVNLSFGGETGHDDFRAMLTVNPTTLSEEHRDMAPRMRESYWAALETVLRLGGQFQDDGTVFVAPYTFVAEIPEDLDAFETYFVTSRSASLLDRPIRFGKSLTRLYYDVVQAQEGGEGTPFMQVRLGDGTTGYVQRDHVRSVVDYRARFENEGGHWRMVTFIAGD